MTKDGNAWTTLFRAPRMHASSGAWLEAFSKSDAQAMLIAVPWTLLAVSLTFFITIYAIEVVLPSLLRPLETVVGILQYLVALCAALYLPVALLLERPSSCCWATGPRRPPEGWLSLLAVAACVIMALCYARSQHSLPDRSQRIAFVHGSVAFRAGATLEFLLQIGWLWAAAGLRCEEGTAVPRWRRWSYFLLTSLWMLTWFGPTDWETQPSPLDHAVVFAGYSARLILFLYCVTRACRKCTRHCQCVCGCCSLCRDDWRCLENLPCTPGRARLRYLLYYLLTRPPFLIIMNLPLGYPLGFLATFALVLRCCLVLLTAVALRPAPAVKEPEVEVETRGKFDILLALRLCDFSCETYLGAPMPAVVVVTGCGHILLNGEYHQEGRDKDGHPQYARRSSEARLRFCDGAWEAVWAPPGVTDPQLRAFAQDDARSPDRVFGSWVEVHGEEEQTNTDMKVEAGIGELCQDFATSGGCDQLDVQWLIAEHHGGLSEELVQDQTEVDEEAPASKSEPSASSSTGNGNTDKVSLVVAFRGTNSVTNVATDMRFSLIPLAEESKTGPFGSAHGQQPVCFDLKDKVKAKLESFAEVRHTSSNPFSPVRSQAREPLRGEREDSEPSESADEQDVESWLSGCCRVIAGCCSRLFFPFLPSDLEDDDAELSLEALEGVRVHKGFAEAYAAVRTDVLARLKERLLYWHEKEVPVQIYATGHSLGGAIANLFALDISAAPQTDASRRLPFKEPVVVYTYGSPRAGNASFRTVYNSLVPETFRIVASRDLVPTLPPSIAYRQLGREVWVDDAGELTFVMSWAMRHILPARDSIWYHAMLSYFRLLNRSYLRKTGQMFPSVFRGELTVREALDGKPVAS